MKFILSSTSFGYNPNDLLRDYPCLKDFEISNYEYKDDEDNVFTYLEINLNDEMELQELANKTDRNIIIITEELTNEKPELEIYDDWRE